MRVFTLIEKGCYIWLDSDFKTSYLQHRRVSSFHIRNISRIRKHLNQSAAEQTGMLPFTVSRRIKYLVFSTVQNTQQLVL